MLFKNDRNYVDLSVEVSDSIDWQAGTLRAIAHHLDITALAIESVSGLLAVGTASGKIIVHGAPGVECTLRLCDSAEVAVRFLLFGPSLFKLLCVDDHHRLHIWDLFSLGTPKLQKVVDLPRPVTSIIASSTHSHAFIALANSEVKAYDMLCLRMSPYHIPSNVWTVYEEKVQAAGASAIPTPGAGLIVDIVIHPRDLNFMFLAYGGGVILSDLKQRNTARAYQLILPPGAPGGAGYNASDILLPRRPAVTAIAVHPSGHVIAIGHVDGSIAFWALEDEERPLLVRTVDDEEDVGVMDVDKLEAALPSGQPNAEHPDCVNGTREPIFKLAWSGFPNSSDPRGGYTVLTVLGGMAHDAPPGITTFLLPPLNPPARPPSTSSSKVNIATVPILHPDTRSAILNSLMPIDSYTYTTLGVVQDFLLVPRASPHFAGAWDPQAVLLLTNSDLDKSGDTRMLDAYEFPPPAFLPSIVKSPPTNISDEETADEDDPTSTLADQLASTLQSMSLSADPQLFSLHCNFWGVASSLIFKVDREAYSQLQREGETNRAFPSRGGEAWGEDVDGQMKLMKFQQRRILITYEPDQVLRFQDVSPQLLVSGPDTPLRSWFPNPLPQLTIELTALVHDPSLRLTLPSFTSPAHASPASSQTALSQPTPGDTGGVEIDTIYLAAESLECVVILQNGAVILHKLDAEYSTSPVLLSDEELVSLTHVPVKSGLRYHPFCAIRPGHGRVTACATSDIGFLAVAYASGYLFAIDLRGPRIILRREPSNIKESRHSILGRSSSSEPHDPIVSLTWTICATSSDPVAHVRLIAVLASGHTSVYALNRASSGIWAVSDALSTVEASPRTVPGGSLVIDAKNGARCSADRQGLAAILADGAKNNKRGCIWVSAGAKSAKCVADIDGERIAKVDWASKVGAVLKVQVVEKNGGCALVAFTDRAQALIYSLPFLEHLHTLQLPQSSLTNLSTEPSGDYVTQSLDPSTGLARQTDYCTLFATRRVGPYGPPYVDLARGRGSVPAPPAPVPLEPQSVIGSMLGYLGRGVTSGEEIDALLAGPNRPAPPQSLYDAKGRPAAVSSGAQGSTGKTTYRAASESMSSGVSDLYDRLGNALAERGQRLGDLEESFNSLEQGSKNMVAQAQKLAAQQSAKRWFGF